MDIELVIVDDAAAAATRAAEELARAARAGAQIALAGGSTPRHAYELAAQLEPDWSRAGVWFGDERCVSPEDERSNYRLARESLFHRLLSAPGDVHRIEGEIAPDEAAAAYDAELEGVRLGLALLGLGHDGHTASLFPYAPSLDEHERRAVAVLPGVEPLVERVTMTVPTLCASDLVVFLAVGHDKAEPAGRAFGQPPDKGTPASLVRSGDGRTIAILDRAAATGLD